MRKDGVIWRPDLKSHKERRRLKCRSQPYFTLIEYGRHLGLQRLQGESYWVARVRTKKGIYSRRRLGPALVDPGQHAKGALSYDEALELAKAWFSSPRVLKIAADPNRWAADETSISRQSGLSSLSDTRSATTSSGSACPRRRPISKH